MMRILTQSPSQRLLYLFLLLYIFFAPISIWWNLPIVGKKFQPAELMFLLMLPLGFTLFRKFYWTKLDLILLTYLGLCGLNFIIHGSQSVLLETIGTVYLFGVYLFISRFIFQLSQPQDFINKAMLGNLILAGLIAIMGFIIYSLGIPTKYALPFPDYPYFGDVVRWKGAAASPNMLLSITFFGLCFTLVSQFSLKIKISALLFALVVLLGTLSKELLAAFSLLSVLIFCLIFHKKIKFKILIPYSIVIGSTMVALTFFVYKTNLQDDVSLNNSRILSESPIYKNTYLEIIPTCYFYFFRNATRLITEQPLTGIGSGSFRKEMKLAQATGHYPKAITTYENHDLYWGRVAELGIGYLFLGVLVLYGLWCFTRLDPVLFPTHFYTAFCIIIAFMLIESLTLGTKHFRHYWIFLGFINGFLLKKKHLVNN